MTKIALTGSARAGKNEVALMLAEHYPNLVEVAFADELKYLCSAMFGDVYGSKNRDALIEIGNSARAIDPDVWVKHLDRRIKFLQAGKAEADFIITDIRYPNEVKYARDNGFTILKVSAKDDIRVERALQSGEELDLDNDGDKFVSSLKADWTIYNNLGLDELREAVNYYINNTNY